MNWVNVGAPLAGAQNWKQMRNDEYGRGENLENLKINSTDFLPIKP